MKTTITFAAHELEIIRIELDSRLQTVAEALRENGMGICDDEVETYEAEYRDVTKVQKRIEAALRRLDRKQGY